MTKSINEKVYEISLNEIEKLEKLTVQEIKREAIELGVYYKMNGVVAQRKLLLYDEMLGDNSPINAVAKRNLRVRLDELDNMHEYIVDEIKRLEAIVGIKSGIVKE